LRRPRKIPILLTATTAKQQTENAAVMVQLMAAAETVMIAMNATVILKMENARIAKKSIQIAKTAVETVMNVMNLLQKKMQ
jgi:hypothetical protein